MWNGPHARCLCVAYKLGNIEGNGRGTQALRYFLLALRLGVCSHHLFVSALVMLVVGKKDNHEAREVGN